MKRVLPWIGLGLLAAAVGGTTFGCSSTNGSNGSGGTGGGLVEAGAGTGGGGTGATGGSGATGGDPAELAGTGNTSSKLGAKCITDAECGADLTCVPSSANDFTQSSISGGPSLGYCTKVCTQPADCTAIASNAQCVGMGAKAYCLAGCDPTGTNECQGRYDEMCLGLVPDRRRRRRRRGRYEVVRLSARVPDRRRLRRPQVRHQHGLLHRQPRRRACRSARTAIPRSRRTPAGASASVPRRPTTTPASARRSATAARTARPPHSACRAAAAPTRSRAACRTRPACTARPRPVATR